MAKKKNIPTIALKDKIIIPVLILAVIVSATLLFNYKQFLKEREYDDLLTLDVMYNNVFVSNYEVAGLTKEQAIAKLTKELQENVFDKKCVYLDIPKGKAEDSIEITYKEMGMKYDFETAVEEAYQFGRKGTAAQRRLAIDTLEDKGEFCTALYNYDRNLLIEKLKSYEDYVNSKLTDKNKSMDIEKTADMVCQSLDIDAYNSHINIPLK